MVSLLLSSMALVSSLPRPSRHASSRVLAACWARRSISASCRSRAAFARACSSGDGPPQLASAGAREAVTSAAAMRRAARRARREGWVMPAKSGRTLRI